MKKLILIALALTLALGIAWAPSFAAAGSYPITIHKTIPTGGPIETFTFEATRDMNNNKVIDAGDTFIGTVTITGAGTGIIDSPITGATIIHEVLIPGSAYKQQPDQITQPGCVPVTFNNELGELGELIIKKVDGTANALAGATFVITPDPKTGAGSLTVVDNGLNDEDPAEGVLLVTGCIIGTVCTVEETVAPPDYIPAPDQTVTISTTVTLTFVNTQKLGELIIKKVDGTGNALAGATFVITPDPKTGAGSLTVVDNGLNDEDPAEGVLLVTGCIIGTVCTVEETVAPPDYIPAPDQTVTISATVTLTFVNPTEERGQLKIKKVGECGRLLGGAEFLIEPNPKTGTGSLTVVDNGLNDEDPTAGILLVTNCLKGITYTVTEKVAPPGYVPGPPQTVTIACEQYLKFVNTKKQCGCGWWGGWWYWRGWCWGSCWGWR